MLHTGPGMVYEPREDSYLLQKWVSTLAKGKVLDVGTGTGILALQACREGCEVVAVDIDSEAVRALKKKAGVQGLKLEVKFSNLFSSVRGVYDVIVFNPPYLPSDEEFHDPAIHGGEKGCEVLNEFIRNAKNHLAPHGFLLFLFSSLTGKSEVEEVLRREGYSYQQLDSLKLDFEELYVYKAWRKC